MARGRFVLDVNRGAVLILVAATALRLRQFLAARPLWLDEASLALNVFSQSYRGLMGHLDFEQVAPVPFLWSLRLATDLAGPGELALRAVPLCAGLLLPFVIWRIAVRALGSGWSLLPLAAAAVNPALIYYSNEVKPYATDALAAAVLIWLVLRVLESPDAGGRWIALALGGAAALLCSFPAALVAAGAAVSIPFGTHLRASSRQQWRFAGCLGVWSVTFAISYGLGLRNGGSSPYLQHFWAPAFLDLHKGVLFVVHLVGEIFQQDLIGAPDPSHRESLLALFVLLLVGVGGVGLWREGRRAAVVLLTSPFFIAVAASALGRYPLVARTVLFSMAPLLVLLAAAVRTFVHMVPRARWGIVVVGALLLIAPGLGISISRAASPARREDLRTLRAEVEARRAPQEAVYVYVRAIPQWTYYATRGNRADAGELDRVRAIAGQDGAPCFENGSAEVIEPGVADGKEELWQEAGGPILFGRSSGDRATAVSTPGVRHAPASGWAEEEADRLFAAGRVWLVFTHVVNGEDRLLLEAVRKLGGARVAQLKTEGATAWEYTFPQTTPVQHLRDDP